MPIPNEDTSQITVKQTCGSRTEAMQKIKISRTKHNLASSTEKVVQCAPLLSCKTCIVYCFCIDTTVQTSFVAC